MGYGRRESGSLGVEPPVRRLFIADALRAEGAESRYSALREHFASCGVVGLTIGDHDDDIQICTRAADCGRAAGAPWCGAGSRLRRQRSSGVVVLPATRV